jgi:hypothetical protein
MKETHVHRDGDSFYPLYAMVIRHPIAMARPPTCVYAMAYATTQPEFTVADPGGPRVYAVRTRNSTDG